MKWQCETRRCVRRFALFPKKLYDKHKMETYCVWLEFYYVIQRRTGGFELWRDDVRADKETWRKWRK